MAPRTSRVGGYLGLYLGFCALIGALWVGIARRQVNGVSRNQDLEALVGGVMIFGVASALWFDVDRPIYDFGPIADLVAGLTLGALVGFVVTGLSLAVRIWTETTSGT